ncbi:MAG: oligosaccharide flippase family protein [Fimbriimonadaceae bacterium]|nr:oligosaccharide flippase family protein [Fimbriimonadaceae bacterium]
MNKSEFTTGFAWNFMFNAINRLAFPVIGILIARHLGPAEMGIFALYASIVTVIDVFRDAGLGSTLIADREHKLGSVASYFWTSISISAILALVVFLLRDKAAVYFGSDSLRMTLIFGSIGLMIGGLTIIPNAILQQQARFRDAGFAELVASIIGYSVCIIMIFQGYGFEALLTQSIIRGALLLAFFWYLAKPKISGGKLQDSWSILAKSTHLLANNIQYTIYTTVDNTFIGKVFGEKALGLYGTMYNISTRPLELVSWPLSRTLFVAFTRTQDDKVRLASILCRSYRAVAFSMVPLYAFLAIYSKPFVISLYSTKFEDAVPILTMLAIYLGVRSFGTIGGTACVAIHRASLNTLCWFLPYVVAITGIWLTWSTRSLISATFWLTLGAVAGYGAQTIVSLFVFRPTAKALASVGSAIACSVGAVILSVPILWLNAPLPIKLVLGVAFVGIVQVILVGLQTKKNPWACFSLKGIKGVWAEM